jgi:membrane dipeptidase
MKLTEDILARGRELHRKALVWDMVWPWEPWCGNDVSKLERFRSAGHSVLSMTIAGDNHNISQAVQRVAEVRRQVREMSETASLCENVAQIRQAHASGRLAVLLHFEGTRCFERNLDMVEAFYKLGVKHTLLAFNQTNSAGGGCMEKDDGGLSGFGYKLIAEMERVGMLLDLSHTGHRTALDAIRAATRPCLFTHSNASALFPHPRNIGDDLMKACAATGGLIGLASSSMYHRDPQSRAESLFEHIDHMVQVVGPQHVGLGLDILFDGAGFSDWMRARPEEWPDVRKPDWPGIRTTMPEEAPRLTACMLAAGYSEADVLNILGGNYVRICSQVWK